MKPGLFYKHLCDELIISVSDPFVQSCNFKRMFTPPMCHMSGVTCHVSCHMSGVIFFIFLIEGLLSIGPTQSSFNLQYFNCFAHLSTELSNQLILCFGFNLDNMMTAL